MPEYKYAGPEDLQPEPDQLTPEAKESKLRQVIERNLDWAGQKLLEYFKSAPLLDDWKKMNKDQKENAVLFVFGVTMTTIMTAGYFEGVTPKFIIEVKAAVAGGLFVTDIILRTERAIRKKFGLNGEPKQLEP